MAVFEDQCTVGAPQEEVFQFFIRPENVSKLSIADTGLRFVTAPDVLSHGAELEFEISTMGIVQRITHKITEFDEPRQFVEEQTKGPLGQWVHEHQFQSTDGGTLVIDRIEFEPPGGMAGFLVTEDKIRASLEKGFHHRQLELKKIFG